MDIVTAIALHLTGCLGLGAAVLRGLGLLPGLRRDEAAAWSFALGQGVWGWLMFWIGTGGVLTAPVVLAALLVSGLGSLFLLPPPRGAAPAAPGGRLHPLLALAAAAFAGMLALEALSPPTDTDSMAYHFALARDFAQAGRVFFVPRAVDGAVPLMVQMHYTSAYVLAGERGMTIWSAGLSMAMILVLYTVGRLWLCRNWAALLALAFATLPATLYGASSGQVEVKLGLSVIIGCLATARAVERGCLRHALVAGLAAGFFMASKYTGLLFAVAAGSVLLVPPRRWVLAPVFALGALAAGFQWYGWNWLHMGDPLFPTLRPWLPPPDSALWPLEFHAWHKATWNVGEMALSRTPWSLLAYPFLATFAPPTALDAARVGVGFLPMALLPFALAGIWRPRLSASASELNHAAAVAVIFALAWFFLGASQRVRHFMPVMPLLLLAAVVVAERITRARPARRAVLAALGFALILQLAGQAVYVHRYAVDWRAGLSREDRLRRQVSYGDVVFWINQHLKGDVRVVHDFRFLNYLFSVPYYNAHPSHQAAVDMSPGGDDPLRFHAGLCGVGGTHVLAVGSTGPEGSDTSLMSQRLHRLVEMGLAEPVETLAGRAVSSRTLSTPDLPVLFGLYKLRCPASLAKPPKIG